MRSKVIALLLSTTLTAAVLSGCQNSSTSTPTDTGNKEEQASDETTQTSSDSSETSEAATTTENTDETSDESTLPTSYEDLIVALHAGQSYAYAPICEGEDALLVSSYTYDDLEGHLASIDASIYILGSDNIVHKVTTVQTGGTAYPLAITPDNKLIISSNHSIQIAYIEKSSGKIVIEKEAVEEFNTSGDPTYHNYYGEGKESEITSDSSFMDNLYDEYSDFEALNFETAGISPDGMPGFAGAVYTIYNTEEFYNALGYLVFDSETSGHTVTCDGLSSVPFDYEQSGKTITFNFGSADDTQEATFDNEKPSFPTLTFSGDGLFETGTVTIACLGNASADSFDPVTYYDDDHNLLMRVKSFDETSFTGDLYHEETIKESYVDSAGEGDIIYSVDGTPFTVISFEDVNKELEYGTDEEFKDDVVGSTRFDSFLVQGGDDDFYYALEKEDYETEYKVVSLMTDDTLKKLIAEDVTYPIKEDSVIVLNKFVNNGEYDELTDEYIIGREFKGDNYPQWSDDSDEYFITGSMLLYISVVDNELTTIVQKYEP